MQRSRDTGWQTVSIARLALVAGSIAGCSGRCPTLEECDIREQSCQRETAAVAACLRGGSATAVSVEVVDAKAFIDEQVSESIANPESADERDLRRGLALLRLMPSSDDTNQTVRDSWNWVGAFYSSDVQKVTVLNRGSAVDGPDAVILLLHEMIHAMQNHDLGAAYAEHQSTYDETLAFAGVLEGEAVLYEDIATLLGYGRDTDDTEWTQIFSQFAARQWREARQEPAPYELAYHRFPYAFGGAYLNGAWRDGGNAGVREVFADLPSSVRQILANRGSGTPSGAPWREDPNEVGSPNLPAEFEHVATRHLGVWLFEIWKDLFGTTVRESDGFSDSGFAGDVLNVYRMPATGDVTSVWRLRFDRSDEAADLMPSLVAEPSITVSRDDRDVIIMASTKDSVPQGLVDGLVWGPAPAADSTGPTSQGMASRSLLCPTFRLPE